MALGGMRESSIMRSGGEERSVAASGGTYIGGYRMSKVTRGREGKVK